MSAQDEKSVGLTKDVGWEIGARRTFSTFPGEAWELLLSRLGVEMWLGQVDGETPDFAVGSQYRLANGAEAEVRVFEPGSHLRMRYHPQGWERPSTIQVRVLPAKKEGQTTISFHEEHLPDAEAREIRKAHYVSALDQLGQAIEAQG